MAHSQAVQTLVSDARLAVRRRAGGTRCLVATEPIEAGEVIASLGAASESREAAMHTVQIGRGSHILPDPECLRYTNHGCEPNLVFDTGRMEVRTLRRVERGAELRYFYPSTEWHMAEPFLCDCGSRSCIREIRGASHLELSILLRYDLAPHILELLASRDSGIG